MLMTVELTDRAEELLEAIRKLGGWVDRKAIATETGKPYLSPHDRQLLDRLVSAGLIEQSTRQAGISEAFIYRALPLETNE